MYRGNALVMNPTTAKQIGSLPMQSNEVRGAFHGHYMDITCLSSSAHHRCPPHLTTHEHPLFRSRALVMEWRMQESPGPSPSQSFIAARLVEFCIRRRWWV